MPAKNPAHSSATYEAPTTNVFPGFFCIENKSSDVMHSFLESGIFSKYVGLPPVQTKIFLAVIISLFPFPSSSSIVF